MPRFTHDQYKEILGRPGYSLPTGIVPQRLCHTKPEQDAGVQSLGADQDEEGGAGRFRVRIERHGARLLDADNLAGSCKYALDALRYRGIIPEDNPEAIDLEIAQKIVPKEERGTLIVVTKL